MYAFTDGPKVSLHVVDDIENFTTMEALLQTVAAIVDCKPTDIHVIALQPEKSFIIVMTMREDLVCKLKEINPLKLRKLSQFKVDWIRIEDKVIYIVEGEFYSSLLCVVMGLSPFILVSVFLSEYCFCALCSYFSFPLSRQAVAVLSL